MCNKLLFLKILLALHLNFSSLQTQLCFIAFPIFSSYKLYTLYLRDLPYRSVIPQLVACSSQCRSCLHVDVAQHGEGQQQQAHQSRETRSGSGGSPATRAMRRGNRRLTRNESRYHSGKEAKQIYAVGACTMDGHAFAHHVSFIVLSCFFFNKKN